MRVWLDDTRPAPRGWHWVTSVDDVVALLQQGRVTELSLDFNLTQTDPSNDGADVLQWLVDHEEIPLPVIHAHTANPWGGAWLAWYWRALEGRCSPTERGLYRKMGLKRR